MPVKKVYLRKDVYIWKFCQGYQCEALICIDCREENY